MEAFFSKLLDYFFYRKCYFCNVRAEKMLMCEKCFEKITSLGFLKKRKIKGITVEGYFYYDKEIKQLIRGIKYHNKKDFAADIAEILYKKLPKKKFLSEEIELIPVPLHDKRYKSRKYNHMELIALELAKHADVNINTNLIKRVKNTKPQYKLTQKERRENLKGAFEIIKSKYSGKKLILFDDICTTGITMEELIIELNKNGIHNISGLVIAFAGK